jgi:hypothetical protein
MARLEELTATPFLPTSTAVVTNAAISVVRAAPARQSRWAFKMVRLTYYGAAPAVAPTLTISGGGLAQPIIIVGTTTGTTGGAELRIPDTALLLAEATSYQIDVPALGAGCIATVLLLDRVVAS